MYAFANTSARLRNGSARLAIEEEHCVATSTMRIIREEEAPMRITLSALR